MLLAILLWLADPQAASSLLQRGLLALKSGNLVEARRQLEEASRADKSNPYVWSSLAETYLRSKMPGQSETAAGKAEQLGGNDPLVCHALAMYYSEAGHPDRAAPFEEKFAESSKADGDALARAAGLYLNAGALDPAYSLARQALQVNPTPLSQQIMGRVLLAKHQNAEAALFFEKAWNAKPDDADLTFEYANALLREESFAKAAEVVSRALEHTPGDPQLELLLGVARYGERRFEDAIVAFLAVARRAPEVEQAYEFLGRLLEQAGAHLPEILQVDQTWAGHNPANARAQLELAKAELQTDHLSADAEKRLRRAIELDPASWEAHYQLGVWLEGRREFAESATQLQRAAALEPKQPLPHYHLARVYDRLGDSAQAESERKLHAQLTAPKP